MKPDARPSEAALECLERISILSGLPPERLAVLQSEPLPGGDRAILNFERWLRATASPHLQAENALSSRDALHRLLVVIGSSQPVADVLIQNPELAHLVLGDEEVLGFEREAVVAEGRNLLASSTSFSHSLDRLRFLKQRWTLPIILQDLFGPWSQEAVWLALSDLADGLIQLATEVVAAQSEIPPESLGVIAFGKLGGRELNYSSDVDLVYVVPETSSAIDKRKLDRYAEGLGRALSDRTGRGSLYRVDLRLRPYGTAGELTPSLAGVEAYYERYAEPWEVQALLKSRVVTGCEVVERWERMREERCFKTHIGEPALAEMVSMRARTESGAEEGDIKRGSGGIRDVEYIAQLNQLVHGAAIADLQDRGTLATLRALDDHGILDHAICQSLEHGYEFLRKLEHRFQLLGDQQTHALPTNAESLETVAVLMGFRSIEELLGKLDAHRRTLKSLYTGFVNSAEGVEEGESARAELSSRLGPAGLSWFDSFALSEEFYAALVENADGLGRVERVLRSAPALVPKFKQSTPLSELLISGEIEEDFDGPGTMDRLPIDLAIDRTAEVYTSLHAKTVAQWAIKPEFDLGARLGLLADALLRHVCRRLYVEADVLALGSYGRFELTPSSDLDLVFLVEDEARQPVAEAGAQALLAFLSRLRRLGAPVEVDLRLRPDGGQGLLVRSYAALKAYDLEGMDLWERFALGQARLVLGSTHAAEVVSEAAFGLPLTPERLSELVAMKRRIETERVKLQHTFRDIKLGRGGLGDIEWFVHLHEMRFPGTLNSGVLVRMNERIRALARASLINAVEAEELLEAQSHLLRARAWLVLQGIESGVVPENPDKLRRLAEAMDCPEGNAFLARHEAIVGRIRQIYEDGLARLRA